VTAVAARVLVGVTTYARAGNPRSFSLPCGYVDGLRQAGATPLLLPPGDESPQRLLDHVDGLVLAGGGDIDPAAYGAEAHETVYSVSEERDAFEFALAREALARRLPMLCICRGMQLLNVVCGGTLHVHVPERFGEAVPHRTPPRETSRHAVRIDPASRLAGVLGVTETEVCSWHHQAVDRVSAALRPVAWAEDGVIEALEHAGHPECLAVQWHPEMQLDEAPQVRLLQAFTAQSRARTP